jgi:hypothetical protein
MDIRKKVIRKRNRHRKGLLRTMLMLLRKVDWIVTILFDVVDKVKAFL